jgi:hypothetical protein
MLAQALFNVLLLSHGLVSHDCRFAALLRHSALVVDGAGQEWCVTRK